MIKLPRSGCAARKVIDYWLHFKECSWSELEYVYAEALKDQRRKSLNAPIRFYRERITYNLSRLLKKYGAKGGKVNSSASWFISSKYYIKE